MKFDLHLHTTASDGTDAPAALIQVASENGFGTIAITDHDTMRGIPEAICAGGALNIHVVPGVEISAGAGSELHILGYGIRNVENVEEKLAAMRAFRQKRMMEMVGRLNAIGIEISLSDVTNTAEESLGRAHLARAMVANGSVKSIKEAFSKYLSPGKPGYVQREKMTLYEALSLVTSGGGIPVIAHPGQYCRDEGWIESVVRDAAVHGLRGIEVYHPSHSARDNAFFERIARRMDLLVTGGSDYHGLVKPVHMGDGMRNWRKAAQDFEKFINALSEGKT